MKRAIVLSGGGSLGAFETGVWKYLIEKGIDYQIVTGTSIGSINAAFIAEGSYEKAVKLWTSISVDKVIHDGFNLTTSYFASIDSAKRDEIKKFAKSYFAHKGADVTPLYQMVRESIDPEKIKESEVISAAVTCLYPSFKEVDFLLKEQKAEDIADILNCSSACYPIFPPYFYQDKHYVDGGYRDNLPIDLAFSLGAEEVIAVSLDAYPKNPQHPEMLSYPLVKIIRPSSSIGSFMDFEAEQGKKNIERGYIEAKKRFEEYLGFSYAFYPDESLEKEGQSFLYHLSFKDPQAFFRMSKELSFEGQSIAKARDIYLRLLEKEGEILGLSHDPVYTIAGFKEAIKAAIDSGIQKAKPNFFSKPDVMWKVRKQDELPFLLSLEDACRHSQKDDFFKMWFATYPLSYGFLALAHLRQS